MARNNLITTALLGAILLGATASSALTQALVIKGGDGGQGATGTPGAGGSENLDTVYTGFPPVPTVGSTGAAGTGASGGGGGGGGCSLVTGTCAGGSAVTGGAGGTGNGVAAWVTAGSAVPVGGSPPLGVAGQSAALGGGGGGGSGYGGLFIVGNSVDGLITNVPATWGGTAGGAGGNGGAGSGGGGGGGGFGVLAGTAGNGSYVLPVTAGGAGGAGGSGTGAGFSGGAGGSGGFGFAGTNGGSATVTAGSISGGNGGAGGAGLGGAAGGAGGNGGAAIVMPYGVMLTVNGTIAGGAGGVGGSGSTAGANGAGGAGIVGAGLTINNTGSISGGLSGDGITRAFGIAFTSGANSVGGAGSISGGIDVLGGSFAPYLPANPAATLHVGGSLFLASAAAYLITINGANTSYASFTGTATLNGATVQVANGSQVTPGHTYTILSAAGGLSGTFNPTVTFGANSSGVLSYDAHDVFLTFGASSSPSLPCATRNQCAVAGALLNLPAGNALLSAISNLTNPGAVEQALGQLSGEIHASTQSVILDDAHYARDAMLGRLRQMPFAGSTGPMASLGAGGPISAYAEPVLDHADSTLAYTAQQRSAFPMNAPAVAPVAAPDVVYWVQGVGAWGKINSDGNAADVSRNFGGWFTGVDRRYGDWRVGLAAGYTTSSVSVNAQANSAFIETGHLGAYAGSSFGPWNVRTGVDLAWDSISTSRLIAFPGFVDSATARYGASEAQLFGEIGYGIPFGNFAAEPFAGLAWVHLRTDPFTETGGLAALNGSGNTDDVGYSTLGARVATTYLLQNGMALTPRASLAWQHGFGEMTPTAAFAFQGIGTGFSVAGVPISRDAALVSAGADLRFTRQASIGVSYVGELAGGAQDQSVRGNFTWKF